MGYCWDSLLLLQRCKESDPDDDNLMSFSNEMPVAFVGKYLERLCKDFSVNEHFLYSRSQPLLSVQGKSLLSVSIKCASICATSFCLTVSRNSPFCS